MVIIGVLKGVLLRCIAPECFVWVLHTKKICVTHESIDIQTQTQWYAYHINVYIYIYMIDTPNIQIVAASHCTNIGPCWRCDFFRKPSWAMLPVSCCLRKTSFQRRTGLWFLCMASGWQFGKQQQTDCFFMSPAFWMTQLNMNFRVVVDAKPHTHPLPVNSIDVIIHFPNVYSWSSS